MQPATADAPIGAVAIPFQHDPPGGLASRCTCVGAPNFAPKRLRSWGLQVHLCSIGALGLGAPRAMLERTTTEKLWKRVSLAVEELKQKYRSSAVNYQNK